MAKYAFFEVGSASFSVAEWDWLEGGYCPGGGDRLPCLRCPGQAASGQCGSMFALSQHGWLQQSDHSICKTFPCTHESSQGECDLTGCVKAGRRVTNCPHSSMDTSRCKANYLSCWSSVFSSVLLDNCTSAFRESRPQCIEKNITPRVSQLRFWAWFPQPGSTNNPVLFREN